MKKFVILFILFISCNNCESPLPKQNLDSLTKEAINKTIKQLMDSNYIK